MIVSLYGKRMEDNKTFKNLKVCVSNDVGMNTEVDH